MRVADLTKTRQIHPLALAELGEEACIIALGVARDLRSGAIPPQKYDQAHYDECGTGCCIAGHIARRMGMHVFDFISQTEIANSYSLRYRPESLFSCNQPSDPILAADAIERYLYLGSEAPWRH